MSYLTQNVKVVETASEEMWTDPEKGCSGGMFKNYEASSRCNCKYARFLGWQKLHHRKMR
jgi:hypothetical protein